MTKKSTDIKPSVHGTYLGKIDDKFLDENFLEKIVNVLDKDKYFKTYSDEEAKNEIISAFKNINLTNFREINKAHEKTKFNLSLQEISWLRKRSESIWGKYLIYRYKFKILPQKHIVEDFPAYLLIEPTSICNLRCVMCFQVDKTFSSNKKHLGFIDIDFFKNLVMQCEKNNCEAITLASRGEPLLHKNFDEICKIVKDSSILDFKLNTNATMMNEKKIKEILGANFSEVIFSVDAGTKETYEQIRVKGNFDKVVNNIKLFNEIRSKNFKNANTITRISGVKVRDDQDIDQMTKFWKEIVDEVTIKEASPRWDTYNNPVNQIKDPCLNLWNRMYVWFDGTINPCDTDYKSFLKIGNAKEKTLKELWNNPKYKKLREQHLKQERNQITPCDRCTSTH